MATLSSQDAYSDGILSPLVKSFFAQTNATDTTLPHEVKTLAGAPLTVSPRPTIGLIWPRGTK